MASFEQFCASFCAPAGSPVAFEYSASGLTPDFLQSMEPAMQKAYEAMDELERGAIANPDENRMVGHYWLRDFDRIPDEALRKEVAADSREMQAFIEDVINGTIVPPGGGRYRNLLNIGIGGSALGPQLVAAALGKGPDDKLKPHFFDNTDPEGMATVLKQLAGELHATLCIVISKSGGTPETRNGMLVAEEAYRRVGLDFGRHAVAVTGRGSKLDNYAKEKGWLARFPMYDWVGGRTSVMSGVGLLPAGLQGIDTARFLAGAREMDVLTRQHNTPENPAALLALYWYHATNGKGEKDMVILPYKDRLQLFSRYLQQLVMESLGKELSLAGNRVEQGITVYGNKGSTDQHAYVQQLRDGVNNFFVIFIEVLKDGGTGVEVEPKVTSGDYLSGFFQGTRKALREKGRLSATLTIDEVNERTLGALIALFERAVGFYASLVDINAYHQPGVEAGKKAAAAVLESQRKLHDTVLADAGTNATAAEWASRAGADPEDAYIILQHLAANDRGIVMEGRHPATAKFRAAT